MQDAFDIIWASFIIYAVPALFNICKAPHDLIMCGIVIAAPN